MSNCFTTAGETCWPNTCTTRSLLRKGVPDPKRPFLAERLHSRNRATNDSPYDSAYRIPPAHAQTAGRSAGDPERPMAGNRFSRFENVCVSNFIALTGKRSRLPDARSLRIVNYR